MTTIATIVEGHGEWASIPVLLRRIAAQAGRSAFLLVPPPIRVPKGKLLRPGEIERCVELAARRVSENGGVLVLMDSDGDCAVRPMLSRRVATARPDKATSVVFAHHEIEAWFLASLGSLIKMRNPSQPLTVISDPESIPSPKARLGTELGGYESRADQPRLAATMDLSAARHARSFDKFYREVCRLLGHEEARDQASL